MFVINHTITESLDQDTKYFHLKFELCAVYLKAKNETVTFNFLCPIKQEKQGLQKILISNRSLLILGYLKNKIDEKQLKKNI